MLALYAYHYREFAIGTPYSVDRSEEVVMEGSRTATLDLKRRNRSSAPYADTEDDVRSSPHTLCVTLCLKLKF